MLAGLGRTVLHHICTTTAQGMTGGDYLLRVGEAAEILDVDARQVYEAIDAGDLPASHVQGRASRGRRGLRRSRLRESERSTLGLDRPVFPHSGLRARPVGNPPRRVGSEWGPSGGSRPTRREGP